MIKRGRIAELDIVRAFAIMGVVAIHSTTNPIVNFDVHSDMYIFYNFVNIFSSFCVPTFIMLSGLVLFYNYYPKDFGFKEAKDFYFKRILYIVIPYITISLIYYVANKLYVGKVPLEIILDFFNKLITGKASYQLYYMVVIIKFYLAFPIFLVLIKKYRLLAKYSILLGFLGQWIFWYFNSHYFHYTRTSIISFSYFSYFFVGAFIGIYYEQAKIWLFEKLNQINLRVRLFRVTLTLVWFLSSLSYIYLMYQLRIGSPLNVSTTVYTVLYNVFTLTTGLIVYQIAVMIYRKYSQKLWVKVLDIIGAVSFGIYLVHPFFYIYYNKIPLSGNSLVYHLQIGGKFVVGLILSWVVVYYISKHVKISWVLFGKSTIRKQTDTVYTSQNFKM